MKKKGKSSCFVIFISDAKQRQHRMSSEYSDSTDSSISDKISNPDYLWSLQNLWHILLRLRSVRDSDMPQFRSKRLYPVHTIFLDSYILAETLPCCNPIYRIVDCINKPLWSIPETDAHQKAKLFFYVIIFRKTYGKQLCPFPFLQSDKNTKAVHTTQKLTAWYLETHLREEMGRSGSTGISFLYPCLFGVEKLLFKRSFRRNASTFFSSESNSLKTACVSPHYPELVSRIPSSRGRMFKNRSMLESFN